MSRLSYYETKAKRLGYRYIAGVDEVGVGPLAGPVVAAAVILRKLSFKNRIDDSKRLTPLRRQAAFEEIMTKADVAIGVGEVGLIEKTNILHAAHIAMKKALSLLRPRPDYVLVDGRAKPGFAYPYKNIVHGDRKSLSIACASIIAKVTRDRLMLEYDRLFPVYSFARHKGYGTRKHLKTLKKYGPCPIHRRTYRPVKNATIFNSPRRVGMESKRACSR